MRQLTAIERRQQLREEIDDIERAEAGGRHLSALEHAHLARLRADLDAEKREAR